MFASASFDSFSRICPAKSPSQPDSSSLSELKMICNSIPKFVGGKPAILDYLIQLIRRSISRLVGSKKTALLFIHGMLQSVMEDTPLELKIAILDLLGF
jgi:hypothetical protein